MKRHVLLSFLIFLLVLIVFADVKIVLKSGKVITLDIDPHEIEKIVFEEGGGILLEKTFDSLEDWTIEGRRKGKNSYEIVHIDGKPWLHLHHEEFTEISVCKTVKLPKKYGAINIVTVMMGKVKSYAGEHSDFYASAGIRLEGMSEGNGETVFRLLKIWSTSDYPFKKWEYIKPLSFPSLQPTNVEIILTKDMLKNSNVLKICYFVYGSGWLGGLESDLWVNYIKVEYR